MKAKVIIDFDEAFDDLGFYEQDECVSNFYDMLQRDSQAEFIARIIKDADDDTLISELERRGFEIKKDD